MGKLLSLVPGYRTKKIWKMVLASLYYLMALLSISGGVGLFLMFLALPFVIFSLGDVIKNRKQFRAGDQKQGSKIKHTPLLKFIGALIVLVIGISVLPQTTSTNQSQKPINESNAIVSDVSQSATTTSTTAKISDNESAQTSSAIVSATSATSTTTATYGQLKVHYIDVGQADSILIQSPSGKIMLIDAGNNADGDSVVAYLKKQGVKKVDILVGTHPHEDHIGGMDNVVRNFDIGSIYMPKASSTTKTFEDLLNAIKSKDLKVTTAAGGMNINFDSSVKTEILAPNGVSYKDLNNYSPVIKMTFGNTSFLFTGDAEDISEQEMLSKKYNLKADVLKVGHHGSSSSTTSAFIKAVSPKYAIISVGAGNDYGHPNLDTINRLNNSGIKVYRTDESGTIIVTSDGTSISIDKKASAVKENAPPSNNTGSSNSTSTGASNSASTSSSTVKPQTPTTQNRTVYYTPNGKSYHFSKSCSTLSRSKTILEGTLKDAINSGHDDPCDKCAH